MSTEEERLAQLLKRLVPEPPVQLSADEITAPSARLSARSWTPPALAAAAVVAIGVTVGLVAAQSQARAERRPRRPYPAPRSVRRRRPASRARDAR